MPTTREQLADWLDEPEGTRFEFKAATQNYQFDKLLEYCVALANEGAASGGPYSPTLKIWRYRLSFRAGYRAKGSTP